MTTNSPPDEIKVVAVVSALATVANAIPLLPPNGVLYLAEIARSIGESPIVLVGSAVLLLFLWPASALGLWRGQAAGWWFAAFLYQQGVFRYGRLLYFDVTGAPQAGQSLVLNHLGAFGLFCFLTVALYGKRVRAWVGLTHWPRKWLIALPVGAVTGFTVLATVAQLLLRP